MLALGVMKAALNDSDDPDLDVIDDEVGDCPRCLHFLVDRVPAGNGQDRGRRLRYGCAARPLEHRPGGLCYRRRLVSADPMLSTALAVSCPVRWCGARRGDRCVLNTACRSYHWRRADLGLAKEFPGVLENGSDRTLGDGTGRREQ